MKKFSLSLVYVSSNTHTLTHGHAYVSEDHLFVGSECVTKLLMKMDVPSDYVTEE